jgi:LacI family transcriptional regulator
MSSRAVEVVNKTFYNMIIIDTNGINDQFGSIERVMEGLAHLVHSRVDGIVFSSIFPESIEPLQMKKILRMTDDQKKVALVSIETDFSKYGVDSVYTNSIKGAEKATRHLLDRGCRRIGHHQRAPSFPRARTAHRLQKQRWRASGFVGRTSA